jgi:3-hydroxyacyl-CoA dehydrogenase/enoyl-CoA hydratase/carnithine racemase
MKRIINLRKFSSVSNNVMNMNIKGNIGIVDINNPLSAVNVINESFSKDLLEILDKYDKKNLKSIIFRSTKKNNFIAGADINMLRENEDHDIQKILEDGHRVISRLSNINSIAVINGSCLGGGLEFALSCKYRIASDNKETIFGLPEVKLGLLPGMGGTQLLPRLIGLKDSIKYMLTGSNINSKKAKQIGLIDYLVDETILENSSLDIAQELPVIKRNNHPFDKFISKPIFHLSRKDVEKKTNNLYPAPNKIIDVVSNTQHRINLNYEKEGFCNLLKTRESKSLIDIFLNSNKLKDKYKNYNNNLDKISVIGSGLMGTGIANVSISNNLLVNIVDKDINNLNKSISNIHKYLNKSRLRGKINNFVFDKLSHNINGFGDISESDLIIEAVSEDMKIKENVFTELDSLVSKETVLATNTSSLSISEISKFSKHPERVIGMHYFSPVEKMPLLEIIKGDKTSEETLSKAISLGKKQGKTIIVVKDVPGFYINRCLTPYMNEALHLFCEGYDPSYIDNIMTDKGFPVGPFTLMDEVGLDICMKVNDMLKNDLEDRIQDTDLDIVKILIENNSLGKKTGKGFYNYSTKNKKENILLLNERDRMIVNITEKNLLTSDQIFERLLFKFLNECNHCLRDGIIEDIIDGDIGAIYGTGFPPYLGGPFNYIDNIGEEQYYEKLNTLNKKYGRYN